VRTCCFIDEVYARAQNYVRRHKADLLSMAEAETAERRSAHFEDLHLMSNSKCTTHPPRSLANVVLDWDSIDHSSSTAEFDERLTAPIWGYRSAHVRIEFLPVCAPCFTYEWLLRYRTTMWTRATGTFSTEFRHRSCACVHGMTHCLETGGVIMIYKRWPHVVTSTEPSPSSKPEITPTFCSLSHGGEQHINCRGA
jgi:hypothetical protein